jgi:cytochrome c peroxidase
MKFPIRLLGALAIAVATPFLLAARGATPPPFAPAPVVRAFEEDRQKLSRAVDALERTVRTGNDPSAWRKAHQEAWLAWKRMEPLGAYLHPGLADRIDGAPLPKVDPDDHGNLDAVPPEGLQVIEELVWADSALPARVAILVLCARLRSQVESFPRPGDPRSLDERLVWEALEAAAIRLASLDVAGFDSPASGAAPRGMEAVLASMERTLRFLEPRLPPANRTGLRDRLHAAKAWIGAVPHFDSLSGGTWIRDHAAPLFTALREGHAVSGTPFGAHLGPLRRPVQALARSLFSKDLLDPHAFAPNPYETHDARRAELGRLLFFDPVLSGDNRRSCASCHDPDQGFADGLVSSPTFDGKGALERNTPGLVDAAFQRRQFLDLRSHDLETQMVHVVTSPLEFNTSFDAIVEKLSRGPHYRALFAAAYPSRQPRPIDASMIKNALASYVRTLVSFDSPFDRWMRREADLSPEAQRGFDVFVGKGACATCHFVPVFNGTVPPLWIDTESEILGTTKVFDTLQPVLDDDPGRHRTTPAKEWMRSFKTPTVRNIALTAPYMHHGAFRTLEEVIEFYDRGGGAGLGLDVPHQTLPSERLRLAAQEKTDLVAFLQSLTDTAGLTTRPSSFPPIPGIR